MFSVFFINTIYIASPKQSYCNCIPDARFLENSGPVAHREPGGFTCEVLSHGIYLTAGCLPGEPLTGLRVADALVVQEFSEKILG